YALKMEALRTLVCNDSAALKASPVQMVWHGSSFTLLESGCVTLDVLAVTAKHVLLSTGSMVEGQATLPPPEQPCDHTHCP
ncbi:unnamed protein product, partial [Coccothraustes coccothraustes]